MFEELQEKFEKEVAEFTTKMGGKFKEFWDKLIEESQKKKVVLEEGIAELKKEDERLTSETEKLASEAVQLSETKEEEQKVLEGILDKQKTANSKLTETNKKVEAITERESLCDVREREQKDEGMRLKAKERTILDREKTVKRAYDELGG